MQQILLGSGGAAAVDVADVFSAFTYTGNATVRDINNGINLSGKGGLVWIKDRDQSFDHQLFDTERGADVRLNSDSSNAELDYSTTALSAFNSNGFALGSGNNFVNRDTDKYISWTFRKASKFFDVVTYTGNGSGQTISHNLGAVPGMIFIKRRDATGNWISYHHSLGSESFVSLNLTNAETSSDHFNSINPTTTQFTLGDNGDSNGINKTFVAYLFAKDESLIKCGTYTGTGSNIDVNCGFTNGAQFVMIKQTDVGRNWFVFDTARGITTGNESNLLWDTNSAETTTQDLVDPLSSGFRVRPGILGTNASGGEYMYMAIAAS